MKNKFALDHNNYGQTQIYSTIIFIRSDFLNFLGLHKILAIVFSPHKYPKNVIYFCLCVCMFIF